MPQELFFRWETTIQELDIAQPRDLSFYRTVTAATLCESIPPATQLLAINGQLLAEK
jgi:hypothetical protein